MNKQNNLLKSAALIATVTGIILLIIFLAMQFTDEGNWNLFDFVFAGVLIFGTAFTYKLITRSKSNIAYRFAVGIALGTGFIIIWANGAVGIIGSEENPVNLVYYVLLLIGLIASFAVRFKPRGMSLTMFALAAGQALIAIVVLVWVIVQNEDFILAEFLRFIMFHGFFVALWTGSASLFHVASKKLNESHT